MGISIRAKTEDEKRREFLEKEEKIDSPSKAAKTMAATEKKLVQQKRTADDEREFQRKMKKAGSQTLGSAKGGYIKKYANGGSVRAARF